jgi:hypothetical protein
MVAALAVTACAIPAGAFAKSKVYNSVEGRVEVYWGALGCAGVELTCADYFEKAVCKSKTLSTGQSGSYKFTDLTADRQVAMIHCSTGKDDFARTGNKGSKKRCAARTNSSGKFGAKCGYSEEEYEELKNEDPTVVDYPTRGIGSRSAGRRRGRD